MREFQEQLYANKLENLDETDTCLDKYKSLRLNKDEIQRPNRSVTSEATETVIDS